MRTAINTYLRGACTDFPISFHSLCLRAYLEPAAVVGGYYGNVSEVTYDGEHDSENGASIELE
jgi:hypothetical protein